MNKYLLLILILIPLAPAFSQNLTTQQWQQIQNEAFMDYLKKNNGNSRNWQQVQNQYTQEYYKNNYQHNSTTPGKRKVRYKDGTFIGNNGPVGSFSGGYITNSFGNTLGYLGQHGSFMSTNGNCVGYVKGYQILNCQGYPIATVKNNQVYNSQGYAIYSIRGETLYQNNYPKIKITGLNMNSLAAYLLFN